MSARRGIIALETTGLKESVAALDHLSKLDAQKSLRAEFKQLAQDAETLARSKAHSKLQQRAAQTLAASWSSAGSALLFGGGFDASFGAEFGAERNLHRLPRHRMSSHQMTRARLNARHSTAGGGKGWVLGWNQFQQWTGNDNTAGTFVWPGIRQAVEDNLPAMQTAIDQIFQGERQ